MKRLNLRMFDGEGAGEGTSGATVQVAAAPSAEDHPASEETPDLESRFEELISGEYREAFEKRMESATKDRLRKQGAKHAKAQEDLQTQIKKQNDILGLIGTKYGVQADDLERLRQEIEHDTTYWEDAAAKEGMNVEQYMRIKRMERENSEAKKALEELQRTEERKQILARWNREEAEVKRFYNGFNFDEEMQNPKFRSLLEHGVDMKNAYEALHMDEIMSGAMAYTAQTVAKRQIDAIKKGQSHPTEGAAASGKAVKTSRDISKMTLAEMRAEAAKARNGERITFREE